MHVRVRCDGAQPRQWHLGLLRRIATRPGCAVSADARPGQGGLPRNGALLFDLERVIHGLPRTGLGAPADPAELAAFTQAGSPAADLVIDLCGDMALGGPPVWRLTFDGLVGEEGLLAALLDGRAPTAALRNGDGACVAAARLGTDYPGVAVASFEDGLARATTLILAALDGGASTDLPAMADEAPRDPPQGLGLARVARRSAKTLARTLARRLYYLCYHAPHWRTGWRKLDGPDLFALKQHPPGGWTDLPDDGSRFYADPFPIEHAGGVTLFVEDFVHALGRGIISAVRFGPEGPLGRPEPVLDAGVHLSYPFVFARDGQVWMIPESCAAGRIDLFRATAFPGGWVHDRTLVADVVASDATIVEYRGRWWMFATVRDQGGAFSDALHLWSAPDFRGPWTSHPKNPVLIDIASARPAGRMVERGGVLLRPVQDCRAGYGAALGFARVLKLDDTGFSQSVDAVLKAGPGWPGRRLHTLNAAGGFEFIDGSGEARRSFFRKSANRYSS